MASRQAKGIFPLILLCTLLGTASARTDNGADEANGKGNGVEQIDGRFYSLSFLAERWRRAESPEQPEAAIELHHRHGSARALLLVGRAATSLDQLKRQAVSNARSTLANFRLTYEADRRLGRIRVAVLRFEGEKDGMALNYYNYYWAGTEGSLQLLTVSPSREYPVMRRDMQALLDGLRISPSSEPAR